MAADDRRQLTARLTEAAAARTADATARARRAITKLNHTGQPITFVAVAQIAGVSTSFLYQNRPIRDDIIARRRTRTAEVTTAAAGSAASLQSLRAEFATAIARNRELTDQLSQPRVENEALRSRLLGH